MTASDVAPPRLPWDAADPYPFYATRRRAGDAVWDLGDRRRQHAVYRRART
nr:hypothetical protein [Mycolicibacterium sp. CBMA 295]